MDIEEDAGLDTVAARAALERLLCFSPSLSSGCDYGFGTSYGYGFGDGDGYGYGYDYGCGCGCGDGDGDGYGAGDVYGGGR